MTAKEYLEQARTMDDEIDSKILIKEQLWALATKMTASLSKGPVIPSRDEHRREEIIAKMVDMEKEIDGDVDRLVDLKREIMEAIRLMPDSDCRTYLEKRYLGKMRNTDICREKNYAVNWGMITHRKALAMIEPILKEKKLIDG